MLTPYVGSLTPRFPMKRRLFTPRSTGPKRFKASTTRNVSRFNKRFLTGPSSRGTLTQQVKSLQRVVKSILPEVKNASISLNQTNITTAGAIVHLTAISQAVTATQRVGEDITVKKISVKGKLTSFAAASNTAPVFYRYFIVKDKQQVNDTVPAIGDIWSTTDPTLALPSISFEDRFTFLWVSPLQCSNQMLNGPQVPACNKQMSCNIKVGYNGTATSDIQKNGIYFGILTDDGNNIVDFTGEARISFIDG